MGPVAHVQDRRAPLNDTSQSKQTMKLSMKNDLSKETTVTSTLTLRRLAFCLAAASLALAGVPAPAWGEGGNAGEYRQTNLVSDLPGVALLQDTNLVNAWGMSFSSTSPIWISDNGSGLSTLYAVKYDSNGVVQVTKQGLEVTIPGEGNPTGQLFNGTGAFHTNRFIFASEDGTISGWRPALGTAAEVLVTRTTAVYKGITLTTSNSLPILLEANFSEGTLDAYGGDLTLLARFMDPTAPAGYAPFNVLSLNGMVFVTFAKQDAAKHDDDPGRGHGLIDVFDPETGTFHRFATGSDAGGRLRELNSPWGLAISPANFGAHADQLLVGNFGSGTIMSFEANGKFRGLLEGRHERPIVIDGLWGLAFGNGGSGGRTNTLYFTAGPAGESHGLFGGIDLTPQSNHGHNGGDGHGHD
jgi:uncharacterized protein (TIGR03118 family)